ncbi:MAG: aspartate-semialdehyde dehydrogenase [Rhodothermia bacterium]|nr:aspartate-semialdehyde dehydrogenase [Rhodothermia bacterium]
MSANTAIRAGILGATGAVGQKFIELLEGHPWFTVSAIAASERSAGKRYSEAANWIGSGAIPKTVAAMTVERCTPDLDCDFVFSGLDSSVAGEVEGAFADAGYPVISNARNHRMAASVPLLIPEVNPEHTALIEKQARAGEGYIVTNPNCSTVGLVCALKPLHDAFGVDKVIVSTMQALSGAGYPGVASLDIEGNVIPYIGGEEDKLVTEPRKLLGRLDGSEIEPAEIVVSAHCNRVSVRDGHMECVSVGLAQKATLAQVAASFRSYCSPVTGMGLPTCPPSLVELLDGDADPQPRRFVERNGGMTVWVGRLRECEVLDFKFVALVHNTVRGAAGGAILNAELLVKQGYLNARKAHIA